jgi:hypothetical protein
MEGGRVEIKVVRRVGRMRDGHGRFEERQFQDLVRIVRWGPFGCFKSVTVLDTEEIPDHALISLGCFGETGGWVSKWSDLVGAQSALSRVRQNIERGFGGDLPKAEAALRAAQTSIAEQYAKR